MASLATFTLSEYSPSPRAPSVPGAPPGSLAQIAPSRRGDIAKLGLSSILAGTLANLFNAAIAGMLIG